MSIDALFTSLNGRDLRYDGVTIVNPDDVVQLLMRGLKVEQLRVRTSSTDVERFNELVPSEPLITSRPEPITFNRGWELPPEVLAMNIEDYVLQRLQDKLQTGCYTKREQIEEATKRTQQELALFIKHGMIDLLRCLIYVLDQFKRHGIVYGVGRGSSCASFVLFLIGFHLVDPIKYSIPMEEFFKDSAAELTK